MEEKIVKVMIDEEGRTSSRALSESEFIERARLLRTLERLGVKERSVTPDLFKVAGEVHRLEAELARWTQRVKLLEQRASRARALLAGRDGEWL